MFESSMVWDAESNATVCVPGISGTSQVASAVGVAVAAAARAFGGAQHAPAPTKSQVQQEEGV